MIGSQRLGRLNETGDGARTAYNSSVKIRLTMAIGLGRKIRLKSLFQRIFRLLPTA